MCIAVFVWKSHPLYPFFLLLNRDEYHSRPTTPLDWWEDCELLGGRDGKAGGTWLACTRDGKLAFLTNVRELTSLSNVKSRGDLPVRFLKSKKTPMEFADELRAEADQYNGFNLIAADLCSMTMVYITNRPNDKGLSVTEVSSGIHVLSNANLDTPWPKAQRLYQSFEDVTEKCLVGEIPVREIIDSLMTDTTKDEDENKLTGIYSPDFEYQLSSIFVEANTPSGKYGTRSTSAVSMNNSREICFYERSLEKEKWQEKTVCYSIEPEKINDRG